ncbi:MAG: histidine kinase dimerization/phosphoacceptor domain -containing protein [Catalinimonas sp.]
MAASYLDLLRDRNREDLDACYVVSDTTGVVVEMSGCVSAFFPRRASGKGRPLESLLPEPLAAELRRARVRLHSQRRPYKGVVRDVPLLGKSVVVTFTAYLMAGDAMRLGWVLRRFELPASPPPPSPLEIFRRQEITRFLYKSTQMGVLFVDDQGIVQEVNQGMLRMLGYQRHEVIGQHATMLQPDEWHKAFDELFERFLTTGEQQQLYYNARHKDGHQVRVGAALERITEPSGRTAVVISVLDLSRQYQVEQQLQRRLRSERFVSQVSGRLLSATIDDLDGVIEQILARLGSFVAAGRAYLFMMDAAGQTISNTHEWCDERTIPAIAQLQEMPLSIYPWFIEQLRRGKIIKFSAPDELPDAAAVERAYFKQIGIGALVTIPMRIDDQLVGHLGLDRAHPAAPWAPEDVLLLKIISELLVSTMGRHRDEAFRRRQHQYLRQVLDAIPNPTAVRDESGRTWLTNAAFDRRPLYDDDALQATDLDALRARREVISEQVFGAEHEPDRTFIVTRKPVVHPNQQLNLLVVGVDITDQKRFQKHIQASLKEKEVLLKEVHHRVKNNMAVISGLLSLQSTYVHDPETRQLFQDSQNRIKSMALIHEKLYQTETLSRIEFGTYLQELTTSIAQLHRSPVEMQVDVPEATYIDINLAVPCGLIVNELLLNAYKHAFKDKTSGRITVAFRKQENQYVLRVGDNGVGMTELTQQEGSESLGMTLVQALVSQLQAQMEVISDEGTTFDIRFCERPARARHAG